MNELNPCPMRVNKAFCSVSGNSCVNTRPTFCYACQKAYNIALVTCTNPENKPIDGIELAKIAVALQQLKAENTALKAKFDEVNRYNISCTKEIDRLLAEKVAPENNPLTNLEVLFGTPEKIADILLPLLPTMEGFCPYCTHWVNGVCEVNPHWDCKNAIINWLNSPSV